MAYLIGIDLGTSSVKTMIMDERGDCKALVSREYDIQVPQAGYAEQSADILWQSTVQSIRDALAQCWIHGNEIAAIGLSGQMHGLVTLDHEKQPVRPVISWADQRSERQVRKLRGSIAEEHSCNPASAGFLLPSLMWMREEEPEMFDQTRYVMLPKDYIRYRLTGVIATDASDASGTLLFQIKERKWDKETAEKFWIPYDILPPVEESMAIIGTISESASRLTGLAKGIPVVCGGGDSPMQLTGSGVIHPGQLVTNIGTASQINCITDRVYSDFYFRLNTFCHVAQDRWITMGAGLNGGMVLKWLKQNVFRDITSYDEMSSLASQAPAGAEGLVFLPFLCGERSPYMDARAKGILFGMSLLHTREHIVRACMESIIYSFFDCVKVFEELGIPMQDKIIASGTGTRSSLWLQMQADILQKEVHTTKGAEESCMGAAIAAGVGCGIYGSLEEGCAAVVRMDERVYEPQRDNYEVYMNNFELYRRIYQNNKELF
ncbi:MAG: xylulokinase [Lachnospiraceae bacterium]|nr:xylulokinase [Lachnospiraceae bacterium]